MKVKVDIQCSNCGKREEMENTTENAVQIIKSGFDPYHDNMKGMNFCPNCGAYMRGGEE